MEAELGRNKQFEEEDKGEFVGKESPENMQNNHKNTYGNSKDGELDREGNELLEHAEGLLKKKKYHECLDLANLSLKKKENYKAWNLRGLCHLQASDYQGAFDSFSKALAHLDRLKTINRDFSISEKNEILFNRATAATHVRKINIALQDLKEGIALLETSEHPGKKSRLKQMKEKMKEVIELEKDDDSESKEDADTSGSEKYENLSNSEEEQTPLPSAEEERNERLELLLQEEARKLAEEGVRFKKNGRSEIALNLFTKSLEKYEISHVYFHRGLTLSELKLHRSAIRDFSLLVKHLENDKSKKIQNLHMRCLLNQGIAHLDLGEYEKANECFFLVKENKHVKDSEILRKAEALLERSNKLLQFRLDCINKYNSEDSRTQEEIQEEVRKIRMFQENDKKQKMKEGSIWHVVSMLWLNNWKNYVHFQEDKEAQKDKPTFLDEFRNYEDEHIVFPGPISNEDIIELEENYIDPDSIKEYSNLAIMHDQVENENYILINNSQWKYWRDIYGGNDIKRFCVCPQNNALHVETKLLKINVVFFPEFGWAKRHPVPLYISKIESVKDLKEKITRIANDLSKRQRANTNLEKFIIKLWRLNKYVDYAEIQRKIREKKEERCKHIKIQAQLLSNSLVLEEAEIDRDDIIIVEFSTKDKHYLEEDKSVSQEKSLLSQSGMSESTADTNSFSEREITEEQIYIYNLGFLNVPFDEICPKSASAGATGIVNIGNTCFMNSSLQCLSNTRELTKYFLMGYHKKELNRKNPLGTGGYLAHAYGELVKNLWLGKQNAINAWDVKKIIAKFAHQFMGFAQQDSQELLTYLVDGIHEDLNRVKKKPYVEDKDEVGTDTEVSKIKWNHFLSRNKSIISDLFYGQLKSRIHCPVCKKVSITFDPFMVLNLPIPFFLDLQIYFVFMDATKDPLRLELKVAENTSLKEVEARILSSLKLKTKIMFSSVIKGHFGRTFKSGDKCIKAKQSAGEIYGYEYEAKEGVEKYYPIELRIKQEKKGYLSSSSVPLSHPRLIVVKKLCTIFNLKKKIFKMFRPFIKAPKYYKNPELMSEKSNQLDSDFEYYFGDKSKEGINSLYQLRLLNNLPKEGGFFSTKKTRCDFCKEYHKEDCIFSTRDDKDHEILSLLEGMKISRDLILILEWQERTEVNLPQMKAKFKNFKTKILDKDVGNKEITLNDCLESFSNEEQLDKDNQYYCTKCETHRQAFKKMDIFRLPKILIINLKRFKHRNSYYGFGFTSHKKLTDFIHYPLKDFDLSPFVKEKCFNPHVKYSLYAVSNHMGSLSGGHYTATCFNPVYDKWVLFNDSHVSVAQKEDVLSRAAYTLFYRRCDLPK